MPVASWTSSIAVPRAKTSSRTSKRSALGTRRRSSSSPVSPTVSAATSISRERIAFANACWKVRPMAITSPTLFMCVDRRRSTPGNFSKAKRGHFTTA